jgi:hypothetical protein
MAVRHLQDKDRGILFMRILSRKTKEQLEMLIFLGVQKELRIQISQGKLILLLKMMEALKTWEPRTLTIKIQ